MGVEVRLAQADAFVLIDPDRTRPEQLIRVIHEAGFEGSVIP